MFMKEYERFEKDDRVVMVGTIEDIPRHRRVFRSVQGVLCPYTPFTEDQRGELLDFARTHFASKGAATISTQRLFPAFIRPVTEELEYAFQKAMGFSRSALLRINSTEPRIPHAHESSLTCTFSGVGTLAVNRLGEEYSAPLDNIFIFHRGIKHRASQYKSAETPKITMMV